MICDSFFCAPETDGTEYRKTGSKARAETQNTLDLHAPSSEHPEVLFWAFFPGLQDTFKGFIK